MLFRSLQATDETFGIYRQLAAQRPDAFLPDLASSLGAKGTVLEEIGNLAGAVAMFREGVECLRPLFLRWPQAFRPLMTNLVVAYFRVCETAEVEVDSDLIGEIVWRLEDDKAGGAHT